MTYYWIGHSDNFATTQFNDGEGAAIALPLPSPCVALWGARFFVSFDDFD